MYIIRTAAALALLLTAVSSIAAESAWKPGPSDNWVRKTQVSIPEDVLSALPDASAGCLVVGFHVLKDGSVDKVRVMQGAYTAEVPAAVQEAFSQAASQAAAGWRFKAKRGSEDAVFKWEVVGFAPVAGHPSLLIEAAQQDARVRAACEIADLAAWGEQHALPPESPEIVRDGSVLVPSVEQPSAAVWVPIRGLKPPAYPSVAARAGIQGCVVVGFVVGSDGKPDQFRVMNSLGNQLGQSRNKSLENAALYGASQWRYSPGPDNLRRMPALIQVPVTFSLGDSSLNRACSPVDIKRTPA